MSQLQHLGGLSDRTKLHDARVTFHGRSSLLVQLHVEGDQADLGSPGQGVRPLVSMMELESEMVRVRLTNWISCFYT